MAFDATLLEPVEEKSGFDPNLIEPVSVPISPAKQTLLDTQSKVRRQTDNFNKFVDAIGGSESAVGAITPSQFLNQPSRVAGLFTKEPIPDPFHDNMPVIKIPKPTGTGFGAGLGKLGAGLVEGLTTPESIMALPAAVQSRVVLALFGGQMAEELPDEVKNAVSVFKDPKSTAADKTVAIGNPVVQTAMIGLLAKSPKISKSGVTAEPPIVQNSDVLTHGDEVHATLPDGTVVGGRVIGADESGNAQIIQANGKITTLPEKLTEEKSNAIQIGKPAEIPLEKPPGNSAEMVEGIPQPEKPSNATPSQDAGLSEEVKSDSELYKSASQRMQQSKAGSPEFMAAWSELEKIKNRNGGMPPVENKEADPIKQEQPPATNPLPASSAELSKAGGVVAPPAPIVENASIKPETQVIQKFRIGNSPQLHSVVEKLQATPVEIANGEQPVRVKNEKTGEISTVLENDLTPVTEKPLADRLAQKAKSSDLDAQLKIAKLDPKVFKNVVQKRAALKRAKAIADFPKEQLSRAPGAAAKDEPSTYSAIQSLADQLEATRKEEAPLPERINAIEKAKVVASDLKDGVKSSLANVLAIKNALWDSYSKLSPYTDMKRIVGKWFYAGQRADFEAREFGKQIVKSVPEKLHREAITNWIQADGDAAILKERSAASKGSLKEGYEISQKLTPREIEIAKMLRDYYDQQLEKGIGEGLLKEGLENYITQVWKKENPIARSLVNELVNSRLQPNFKFARKRIFDSYFEGEQAGYKPVKDAGFLVANYDQSFNKSLAARAFIKDLHEGVASDGRPLVEVSGSGKLVDAKEPKPRFIIKPKSMPEAIGDYKTIDHPALRGWKWLGQTPEGADVLMQGELKVHPEIYSKLKNRLSTSWFRQNPAARGILNLQSTLKQSMMSISGFHQVQENLHALGHRVNPMNLEKLDFSEPVTKSLVEHGLQLADYNALEQFGEGLSSGHLLNKIPLVGDKLKSYNDWLFQDNIPRLKLTMAKHALDRNKERYTAAIKSGKITPDQVLELTASQANHAFGELPYKYWGRNPNLQDFYRTFLLAPDFLEARAGFVGQAVKPGGLGVTGLLKNEQLQALAVLALTQYITARIVNQIIDQDPHWELKNAFRIISGNHAYSLRTVPGDIIHLLSDPRGFTYNRLSPMIGRGAIEAITGRDYRGVKRDFFQQMTDLLKSGIPISFNHKNGQTILETFGNAFGVQNQRYDAVQNIQQKVQDFKTANNIKTPYETTYDIEADIFAPLRNAIQEGNQKLAQQEFDKLKIKTPAAKIKEHFHLSYTRPFTGSSANESKFYKGLNEVGRQEYKEAKDLRAARLRMVQSLH